MSDPIITVRLRMVTLTSEEGMGMVLAIDRDGKRTEALTMRMEMAQWFAQLVQDWAAKPELYDGAAAMWMVDGEPVGEPFQGGQPGEVGRALPQD